MRFLYIFLVAAFLAVAYAATTSDTETEVEQVPHSRQKRTILLKKKLALLGGALLAKKLIAGKLLYKGFGGGYGGGYGGYGGYGGHGGYGNGGYGHGGYGGPVGYGHGGNGYNAGYGKSFGASYGLQFGGNVGAQFGGHGGTNNGQYGPPPAPSVYYPQGSSNSYAHAGYSR